MIAILANAGVPMIIWQMPFMVVALIPIIALETVVARAFISAPLSRIAGGVGVANVVSTFIGMPIAWGVMLVLNIVGTGTAAHGLDTPLNAFKTVVLQASWLIPYEDQLHWLMPAATLVLLIPYFVVSVIIERFVLCRLWKNVDSRAIRKAAWGTNSASYAILGLLTAIWLAMNI